MPAGFHWVHGANGYVPENAVEAGRTVDGEMLYIGRTFKNGIPCAGKVRCEIVVWCDECGVIRGAL